MLSILTLAVLSECVGFYHVARAFEPGPASAPGNAVVGKTYYVSSKGTDTNDGMSPSTPFASLAKLNTMLSTGDAVKFKCGEVYFGTFKPTVSGTAVTPISVSSYGTGTKPLLTVFKAVTNWTSIGNGLYQAVLDPAPTSLLEMVRFDQRLQPKGRLPKAERGWKTDSDTDSWFEIKSHTANKQITTKDAIPEVTGGEIVQKKYQWILDRGHIDSISTASVDGQTIYTINITEYPVLYNHPYDAFDKHGFFVQNHIQCLTELGDWCYDAATHKITMYFGTDLPAQHDVQAACLDHVTDLTNRSYISFDNVAFAGSNSDLVKLDVPPNSGGKCHHVSLSHCELSFAGRDGIGVVPHQFTSYTTDATHGTVTHCTISNINNNGISPQENPNWTITHNSLQQIAMHEGLQQSGDGQGTGIHMPGADSLIQYNDLSYVGYCGLSFVGSGTQIRNNHIHHYCMIKSDGGAIYAYGGEERKVHAKPRVVDQNIVHDGLGNIGGVFRTDAGNPYAPQCQGIYMDGNVTDVIVTDNTSFKNATAGLWLGSNGNITAYGNTLADNHTTQLQIDNQKSDPTDLKIHDNLLFAFEREQLCLTVSLPNKKTQTTQAQYVAGIGTLSNNLYLRPIQEPDNVSTTGYIHCCDGGLGHDPDKSYTNYGAFNDYTGGGVVSITWDGSPFLSLDKWQQNWEQDAGTKKTFRNVAKLRELRLEYNPTNTAVGKALPGAFEDAKGTVYRDTITLQPYSSAVLMLKK